MCPGMLHRKQRLRLLPTLPVDPYDGRDLNQCIRLQSAPEHLVGIYSTITVAAVCSRVDYCETVLMVDLCHWCHGKCVFIVEVKTG